MTFSVIDIVFVALIGLLMIRCYLKGFVSELLSMAGIVFGLFASLYFYKNGGQFIREKFLPESEIIPEIIAFVLLFIIVCSIIKLLEKILLNIIDQISLTGADSFIGIIFGFAEGIVVVSLILFLLKIQPLFDSSELLDNSFFARLLLPFITGNDSLPSSMEVANV
ncbi:MAG: CvpA family protein [Treponema sp.]|nr:CvpA family protein [Treponema sp.]